MRTLQEWSKSRQLSVSGDRNSAPHAPSVELQLLVDSLLDSIGTNKYLISLQQQRVHLNDWVDRQSSILKHSLDERVQNIRQTMTVAVSNAIAPLLNNAIRSKAVEDFCALLEQELSPESQSSVTINVPRELHSMFIASLRERGLNVVVQIYDGEEISTIVGQTHINTKIASHLQIAEGILKQ